MDHMEMVEKLREKTGLTYEESRAALEKADWNLLDALITLEKEGKVRGATRFSTRDTESEPSGQTAEKTEGSSFGDLMRRFWKWLCNLFRRGESNQFCMLNRHGETTMSIPVLLFALLLLFAFWVVLPLMIVALFFGCRFQFRGPDLGKESVNNVMGKATDVADEIKDSIRGGSEKV